MSKTAYVNVSATARPLAAGPMLAPGATSTQVDPKDPSDKALIAEGHLVVFEGKEES